MSCCVSRAGSTVVSGDGDSRDPTVEGCWLGGRCPCCFGRARSTGACHGEDSSDPTVAVFVFFLRKFRDLGSPDGPGPSDF